MATTVDVDVGCIAAGALSFPKAVLWLGHPCSWPRLALDLAQTVAGRCFGRFVHTIHLNIHTYIHRCVYNNIDGYIYIQYIYMSLFPCSTRQTIRSKGNVATDSSLFCRGRMSRIYTYGLQAGYHFRTANWVVPTQPLGGVTLS